ncbi:MAG: UDP-glucose/GDP-mannose dehydrogenase family protein [Chloroflexi bacterium]|nr:UDP-glucose/GDP-mannose dehydrogenase family protein [Chloroflexota bacterium]
MSRLCVIGSGYVGLVTGACLADLGHGVRCVDIDEAKVALLKEGRVPFYEPGLEEVLRRNQRAHRLDFTVSYPEGMAEAEFIFVAVNTPAGMAGEADMTYIRQVAEGIAGCLRKDAIIVNKSTVPIGTGDLVAQIIHRHNDKVPFGVVSNPEFLREGRAVADFMEPDRIVLGATDKAAAQEVATLYSSFKCPIIITDLRTAEMIKYASNAFLATRISFMNEIAAICEKVGADVKEVARSMGLDRRIGSSYLEAGLGYGGSCFPKDVQALAHMAAIHGCHPQLLRAVMDINQDQKRIVVQRLRQVFGSLEGRVVGLLGLSFKPDTDDLRSAPSLEIIHLLQSEGARVKAYDPAAMEAARRILSGVELCPDAYATARDSDALVVVTEWNEFKQLDRKYIWQLMRHPVVVDGRNIYEAQEMVELGFIYFGVGRGHVTAPASLVEMGIDTSREQ